MKTPILLALSLAAFVVNAQAEKNAVAFDIQSTKEFPRNSEGSFVTLKSGRVLCIYTQFYDISIKGGAGDGSPAHIVAVSSDDQGRTWSKNTRMIIEHTGGVNVMSVSLLRLKSGRIALFYLVKNSVIDCRPHVQFSDDEGETWTAPKLMVAAPGYFALNNDRVIQHSSGRLIAPMAYHRSKDAKDTDAVNYKSLDLRAIALWYVSDDDGGTWSEAPEWLALSVPSTRTGLQEPGIVELSGGSLLSWFRTDQGVQFATRSTDVGKTWSPPEPMELRSPASPASIKRLPNSSALLAVYNDHSGRFPYPTDRGLYRNRAPLVAAISIDGGKKWTLKKLLEGDVKGEFAYSAVHFLDNAVLFAYNAHNSDGPHLGTLRIRRVALSWLFDDAK